eukprot:c17935_g1_i1.p1 GENE.c17935_g1_i1~~c17935_g1_i1.p1  ORF type:complete len:452 (+),score=77.27 c17935_g1_i1:63-1418(+)
MIASNESVAEIDNQTQSHILSHPHKSFAPVPSLSLSFASDVHIPDEEESPRSESSSGRRSSGRDRSHHFSPYPLAQSPRLQSPRSSNNISPNSASPHSPHNPIVAQGHLKVEEPRGHRRVTSDPRNLNQQALAKMISEGSGSGGGGGDDIKDFKFMSIDAESDVPTQTEFATPKTTALPISATLNIVSNDTQDRPDTHNRHRRTKSDSASLKVFSSAEGYRLVIPPQALKSLKDVDPQDQSVTVFLSRDPADDLRARNIDASLKSSTRPKYYKCSKCGQPKKGHVCEFGNEKPIRSTKAASPSDLNSSPVNLDMISPHNESLTPFTGPQVALSQPFLQTSLVRDFETRPYTNYSGIDTTSLLMQRVMESQPASIFHSMHELNEREFVPSTAMFDIDDMSAAQNISDFHNPLSMGGFESTEFRMDTFDAAAEPFGAFYNVSDPTEARDFGRF